MRLPISVKTSKQIYGGAPATQECWDAATHTWRLYLKAVKIISLVLYTINQTQI
jgi:hypothetical protein